MNSRREYMDELFISPIYYHEKFLDKTKCRAFIDDKHEVLIKNIIEQKLEYPESSMLDECYQTSDANPKYLFPIFENFKKEFQQHLTDSKLNAITGFESFLRSDLCLGCTQFMDNLHIVGNVQVLDNEYRYHRLINPNVKIVTVDSMIEQIPLIISIPFSAIGKTHEQMQEILDICLEKKIPVHLDGAWITAAKNVCIDLSHPAIRSFATSMSKGYGLTGWNRIGVRWIKDLVEDSITVMNDYSQINSYSVTIGRYFLQHIEPDHLWIRHGDHHLQICKDFDLESTDSIHMAIQNGKSVGLAQLLKWMERNV